MTFSRTKVIEEMLPLMPSDMAYEVFDFGLHLRPGSTVLIKKLLFGPWDGDFVVAQPGETISYADFKTTATSICNLPGVSFTPPEES